MGLSLQVGVPRHVLQGDAARDVAAAIRDRLGYAMPWTLRLLPWSHRDEIAVSWVEELQSFAAKLGSFPHLAACDGWSTVYLPTEVIVPTVVEWGTSDGRTRVEGYGPGADLLRAAVEARNEPAEASALTFVCASLPRLGTELQALSAAAALSIRDAAALAASDDPVRSCFGHFVLATSVALKRHQPLWVVK